MQACSVGLHCPSNRPRSISGDARSCQAIANALIQMCSYSSGTARETPFLLLESLLAKCEVSTAYRASGQCVCWPLPQPAHRQKGYPEKNRLHFRELCAHGLRWCFARIALAPRSGAEALLHVLTVRVECVEYQGSREALLAKTRHHGSDRICAAFAALRMQYEMTLVHDVSPIRATTSTQICSSRSNATLCPFPSEVRKYRGIFQPPTRQDPECPKPTHRQVGARKKTSCPQP